LVAAAALAVGAAVGGSANNALNALARLAMRLSSAEGMLGQVLLAVPVTDLFVL